MLTIVLTPQICNFLCKKNASIEEKLRFPLFLLLVSYGTSESGELSDKWSFACQTQYERGGNALRFDKGRLSDHREGDFLRDRSMNFSNLRLFDKRGSAMPLHLVSRAPLRPVTRYHPQPHRTLQLLHRHRYAPPQARHVPDRDHYLPPLRQIHLLHPYRANGGGEDSNVKWRTVVEVSQALKLLL